jgi:hypothetical protein
VQQVYTPADYELLDIMEAIVGLLEGASTTAPRHGRGVVLSAHLDVAATVDAALAGKKGAVSRLVSLFEDQRPAALAQRADVVAALEAAGSPLMRSCSASPARPGRASRRSSPG